jgi:predicted PurR-regulated permease PerM
MSQEARTKDRWTLAGIRVWTIVGLVVLVLAGAWLVSALSFALLPMTLGLLIVLLLEPPVEYLSRFMPRAAAVLVMYLSVLAGGALALYIIIPPVTAQVIQFGQAAGTYVVQVFDWWKTSAQNTAATPESQFLLDSAVALKSQLLTAAANFSTGVAQFALTAGGWVMNIVFNVTLALMIAFYALADLPRVGRELFAIAGEGKREELTHAISTTSRVVGGWLTGTLLQMVVVAVLGSVGLVLLNVPYALLLGVLGGLLTPVPYVGSTISWILAGLAGLIISPWMAVWAFLVAWAASNINGFVIAPRIMGNSVDLHPLIVLAAILVGTSLFGVAGMVFSVPVVAVAKGMLIYRYEKRTDTQITTEDGILFQQSAEERQRDDELLGRE